MREIVKGGQRATTIREWDEAVKEMLGHGEGGNPPISLQKRSPGKDSTGAVGNGEGRELPAKRNATA